MQQAATVQKEGVVKVIKLFNLLRIPPLDPDAMNILWKYLTYRYVPYSHNRQRVEVEDIPMYTTLDIGGYLTTLCAAGAKREIQAILSRMGYTVKLVNRAKPKEHVIERMRIDRERFKKIFTPRKWQIQLLDVMEKYDCGQIQSATGSGKSTVLKALAYALPHASILYTTRRTQALEQQYRNMLSCVPSTVKVKSGSDQVNDRVVCCTVGKLSAVYHRVFDYVFVDEHHSTCTPSLMQKIIPVKGHKYFAFSANYHDRSDGADRWSDVVYGPLRLQRTYSENVSDGDVTRVEVRWRNTDHIERLDTDSNFATDMYGIVHNEDRNLMIVEDARRHPDDQVLIVVKRTEHALMLARALQCVAVYGTTSPERESELRELGLIERSEKLITKDEVNHLRELFTKGTLRLAVATTIWGEAVDFPRLNVLIRADGQASVVQTTQIGGRTSRIHEAKTHGIVYDYEDSFHESLKHRSNARKRAYAELGYSQVMYDQDRHG